MKRTAIFVLLACTLSAQQTARKGMGKSKMPNTAQEYIAAFERGEGFRAPATGVIVGGRPDGAAVETLGAALAGASPQVREDIVALLVDMGRRTDPLTPRGADVLRHSGIIAILAGPGLAKADLGREAAMDALRKLVTQAELARYGAAFLKALKDAPTEEAFLLVAKAKPVEAKPVVDKLAAEPKWRTVEAARIARAAVGALDVEDQFLAAVAKAEAAADGRELARAVGTLGLIGTQRSLKATGERLRTPLTIHVPQTLEKSVRLSVLEALLYNYPDQPALYPNNINSEADYTAAERFCTSTLGVVYRTPPPPFLKYRAFPVPLAR